MKTCQSLPLSVGRIATGTIFVFASIGVGLAQQPLGDLTGSWQLFVDDSLVAAKTNVSRSYYQFQKVSSQPVLAADRPWESDFIYTYGTVLPQEDGDGYRIWYHSYSRTEGHYRNMYAESDDGVNWTKPNLGIESYGGSKNNNIFWNNGDNMHLPQVIHSPWDSPDSQYKLTGYDYALRGFHGATSADGLHWTNVDGSLLFSNTGDVGNFVWDPHEERYMATPKIAASVRGFTRRCVGSAVTDGADFTEWSTPMLTLVPDELDDYWVSAGGQRTEFYGLSAFPYESGYLGFLWIFHITDGKNDGPIYPELVSSRDGIRWTRQEPAASGHREPLLPLGPSGAWDDGMIFTTNHPLVEGDTVKLWYGGINDTHGYPGGSNPQADIGMATLRKDGFASLDAGIATGEILTKPLVGASGPLLLNADASHGWIQVEVLDHEGNVVPGYGTADFNILGADGIDLLATWGAKTELPVSQNPLSLRFIMKDASVYSFNAGENVELYVPPYVRLDPSNNPGVLFTFEGDQAQVIHDSLMGDGPQDPPLVSGTASVVRDAARAAHGESFMEFPSDPATGNLFEIPGTKSLGRAFTLSATVDETGGDFSRLFSAYNGGTPADDELVLDIDPSGTALQNVRGIVHGVQVKRPVDFGPGRYHDIAMTYYDGELRIYFDGIQLGETATVPGGPVELLGNLLFGEDYPPTSLTNEPFEGRADDILVVRRPLTASRMAALSQQGAAAFFAESLGSRFHPQEGDTAAVDRRTSDGAQNGAFLHAVSVDADPARSRLGDASFLFEPSPSGSGIEIAESSYLGEYFTLAAFIRPDSAADQLFFGAESLVGGTAGEGLSLELLAEAGSFSTLAFTMDGEVFSANLSQHVAAGEYHHVAVTFTQGNAVLYFDGAAIGTAGFDLDVVELDQSLFFGLLGPNRVDKSFAGNADDLIVAFDALSAESVFDLANPEFAAADINDDGLVGSADLDVIRANWGAAVTPGDASSGDVSGDGLVGSADLDLIRGMWGASRPGVRSVPEPAVFTLLLVAFGFLGKREDHK